MISWLRRLLAPRPLPQPQQWLEFSIVLDGVRTIYPSEAAFSFDPAGLRLESVWYARLRRANGTAGPWTRIDPTDPVALRRLDS